MMIGLTGRVTSYWRQRRDSTISQLIMQSLCRINNKLPPRDIYGISLGYSLGEWITIFLVLYHRWDVTGMVTWYTIFIGDKVLLSDPRGPQGSKRYFFRVIIWYGVVMVGRYSCLYWNIPACHLKLGSLEPAYGPFIYTGLRTKHV